MRNQTAGHLANNGGIRGHSAGDIFPYVIMIKGSWKDGFSYHVTGQNVSGNSYGSYNAAQVYAQVLVALN